MASAGILSTKKSINTKVEWNNGDKIETTTTVVVQEFADKVTTTTTVKTVTHKVGGGKRTSTKKTTSTKGKAANAARKSKPAAAATTGRKSKPSAATGSKSSGGGVLRGADATFIAEFMKVTNDYRAKHGAKPLKYNDQLAKLAQRRSDYLAKIGKLQHGDLKLDEEIKVDGKTFASGTRVGQNLSYRMRSPAPAGHVHTGGNAVKAWYDEISNYNWAQPRMRGKDPSKPVGHFTQVVWDTTEYVGAGITTKNGSTYITADYLPAGNIVGKFGAHVKKPL